MEKWVGQSLSRSCTMHMFNRHRARLTFSSAQYCWRWTGFNFGFDLLVTYTNRFIVFKRNTLSQPCGGAVSLQPRRHLAYRSALQSTFKYSFNVSATTAFFCLLVECQLSPVLMLSYTAAACQLVPISLAARMQIMTTCVFFRLRLASFDSRGKLVCSRSTGYQLLTLEKDQVSGLCTL